MTCGCLVLYRPSVYCRLRPLYTIWWRMGTWRRYCRLL